MDTIKLSTLKNNPKNPHKTSDSQIEKLCQKLKDFPKFLELIPILVDSANGNIVLSGNKRLTALKKLGYKVIPKTWVRDVSELTEEEKKQLVVAANSHFGEWDYEALELDYTPLELESWDIALPSWDNETEQSDSDFSDKNKEIDIDSLVEKGVFKIVLEYTENDYSLVKQALQDLGKTPEQILFDALKLKSDVAF